MQSMNLHHAIVFHVRMILYNNKTLTEKCNLFQRMQINWKYFRFLLDVIFKLEIECWPIVFVVSFVSEGVKTFCMIKKSELFQEMRSRRIADSQMMEECVLCASNCGIFLLQLKYFGSAL